MQRAIHPIHADDMDVCSGHVPQNADRHLIYLYECIVIDTSRKQASKEMMTGSQQDATTAPAATSSSMRRCDDYEPRLQYMNTSVICDMARCENCTTLRNLQPHA